MTAKYTVDEISEMHELIGDLMLARGILGERATQVGALLQAHVINGTDIADLREAVRLKQERDDAWEDECSKTFRRATIHHLGG